MLQIVASLTDDTRSVNYDRNIFIIQATDAAASTWSEIVEKERKIILTLNCKLTEGLTKILDGYA